LAMVATSDMLVSAGVWTIYPISWLPALLGSVLGMWVLWRANRLRGEGIDRRGVAGLLATCAAAGGVVAVVVAAPGGPGARPRADRGRRRRVDAAGRDARAGRGLRHCLRRRRDRAADRSRRDGRPAHGRRARRAHAAARRSRADRRRRAVGGAGAHVHGAAPR